MPQKQPPARIAFSVRVDIRLPRFHSTDDYASPVLVDTCRPDALGTSNLEMLSVVVPSLACGSRRNVAKRSKGHRECRWWPGRVVGFEHPRHLVLECRHAG